MRSEKHTQQQHKVCFTLLKSHQKPAHLNSHAVNTLSVDQWKLYNVNTWQTVCGRYCTVELRPKTSQLLKWRWQILKDRDEMYRCDFAIYTICLDRIRTSRNFSVSSMSVDEVCSNKSLLQFFKDTVTKEMTGSRSSIIYPHPLFLPSPYSSAQHTSHPYMRTYIHVTITPLVAW